MSIETRIPGFEIRTATLDDVPLILSFINGIATFEGLLQEVSATEDTLRASLFGKNPAAHVLFGVYQGTEVSFATYYFTFSSFTGRRGLWLDDLFILPEYRKMGFGKVILSYIATLARERDCARFEWIVLGWNEKAHRFYDKLGAETLDQWRINRVSGEALERLADEF